VGHAVRGETIRNISDEKSWVAYPGNVHPPTNNINTIKKAWISGFIFPGSKT
jgi:hypothetical protein